MAGDERAQLTEHNKAQTMNKFGVIPAAKVFKGVTDYNKNGDVMGEKLEGQEGKGFWVLETGHVSNLRDVFRFIVGSFSFLGENLAVKSLAEVFIRLL